MRDSGYALYNEHEDPEDNECNISFEERMVGVEVGITRSGEVCTKSCHNQATVQESC